MTVKTVCKLSHDGREQRAKFFFTAEGRSDAGCERVVGKAPGRDRMRPRGESVMKMMMKAGSDDESNEVTDGGSRPSVEVELTCENMGLVLLFLGIHGQLKPLRKKDTRRIRIQRITERNFFLNKFLS